MTQSISIVIPVYREATEIGACLQALARLRAPVPVEVIVVDGADGSTLEAVSSGSATLLRSERGRAVQLNRGARRASGSILLFLHVDTFLPRHALHDVLRTLRGAVAGAFDLAMMPPPAAMRLVGLVGRLRSRLTRVPYGDQAQFFRRSFFERLGGYPTLPIMEDVAMMEAVRRRGRKVAFVSSPARTSSRRYRSNGVVRGVALNTWRMLRYHYGGNVGKLAANYRPQHDMVAPAERLFDGCAYAVFFRDVEAGRVKTRLAAQVGVQGALEAYHAMVDHIVGWASRVRGVVTPFIDREPHADVPFDSWTVQEGDSLGAKMLNAFTSLFEQGYERVVLTGTDIPGLEPVHIEDAFLDLLTHDAVVGPARDTGYYLIGFRREAFTDQVFAEDVLRAPEVYDATVKVLELHGRTWIRGQTLDDVDTISDLRRWATGNDDPTHPLAEVATRLLAP